MMVNSLYKFFRKKNSDLIAITSGLLLGTVIIQIHDVVVAQKSVPIPIDPPVATADFNGDGVPDFLVINKPNTLLRDRTDNNKEFSKVELIGYLDGNSTFEDQGEWFTTSRFNYLDASSCQQISGSIRQPPIRDDLSFQLTYKYGRCDIAFGLNKVKEVKIYPRKRGIIDLLVDVPDRQYMYTSVQAK